MEDGALKVQHIMPREGRPKDYRKVDIEAGDLISMANGKSMTGLDDLKVLLETLEVGDEIKLGIKRGQKMFIASFTIADEKALGGGRMVMKTIEIDDDEVAEEDGQGGGMRIKLGEGSVPWLEMSCILEDREGEVVVSQTLPFPCDIPAESKLAEGDVILMIQGQEVKSADEFMKTYLDLPVGETVRLGFTRDGADKVVSFTKPTAIEGNIHKKQ